MIINIKGCNGASKPTLIGSNYSLKGLHTIADLEGGSEVNDTHISERGCNR